MRRRPPLAPAAALMLVLIGCMPSCRRREAGVFIVAPFNDHTRLARITATWTPGPAEGTDDAVVHYEVRVENRLQDGLYVRIGAFSILDSSGRVLGTATGQRSCSVAGGTTAVVLAGSAPMNRDAVARAAGFAVERFGVPLSERGRGIYREFLLQSGRSADDVERDLAGYRAAPPCG